MDQAGPNRPTRATHKPTWMNDFVCNVKDLGHSRSNDQLESLITNFCRNLTSKESSMESSTPEQVSGRLLDDPVFCVKYPECDNGYATVWGLKKHTVLHQGQRYDHATWQVRPFCTPEHLECVQTQGRRVQRSAGQQWRTRRNLATTLDGGRLNRLLAVVEVWALAPTNSDPRSSLALF